MIPAKALGLTGPSASARGLSAPPPRAPVPSARSSARNLVEDDEDDDGRTQIRDVGRGRPKANGAFGMATAPQPSAVLRASLQAPGGRVPPDRSSSRAVDRPSARPAPSVKPPSAQEEREHTVQLDMTGGGPRVLGSSGGLPIASASRSGGYPMASSSGALPVARLGSSGPMPASPRLAGHSGAYPGVASTGGFPVASTGGFPVASTGGFPVAAGSSGQLPAPAHFMVPQAPYSGPGLDPPGAAITLSASKAKRPAMSWAVSLMVMGLAVGIASVLITHGKAEAFADTSAAFVDPARAGEPAALQPAIAPAPAAPPAIAAAQPAPEAPVAVVPPAVAQPAVAAQPVAPQPVAAPPPVAPKAAAPSPQPKAVAWSAPKAPEAPKAQEGPKPVAHASSSGASSSPSKSSASASSGTSKSHTSSSSSKGSGGHDDAEMKAAMEALQKAQTESSF